MNEKFCDNKSAGVILKNNDDILLLDRARFPFGLAPPAGHIDEHGSYEDAAVNEVFEEVGITIAHSSLVKVIDSRRVENTCRRLSGDHHVWNVYSAETDTMNIQASIEETNGAAWYTPKKLQSIANITREKSGIETKPGGQVMELIWLDFLVELGYVE